MIIRSLLFGLTSRKMPEKMDPLQHAFK